MLWMASRRSSRRRPRGPRWAARRGGSRRRGRHGRLVAVFSVSVTLVGFPAVHSHFRFPSSTFGRSEGVRFPHVPATPPSNSASGRGRRRPTPATSEQILSAPMHQWRCAVEAGMRRDQPRVPPRAGATLVPPLKLTPSSPPRNERTGYPPLGAPASIAARGAPPLPITHSALHTNSH